MIEEIKKAREAMRAVEENLYATQNRLRAKESQLINVNRVGNDEIGRRSRTRDRRSKRTDHNEQIRICRQQKATSRNS